MESQKVIKTEICVEEQQIPYSLIVVPTVICYFHVHGCLVTRQAEGRNQLLFHAVSEWL